MSQTGVSSLLTFGQLYGNNTTLNVTPTTTDVNITGNFTASGTSNRVTLTTTGGKITFNGPKTETLLVKAEIVFTASAAHGYIFTFYKNGAAVSSTATAYAASGTGTNICSLSMSAAISCSNGDYLQLYVQDTTTTSTITPSNTILTVMGTNAY